MFSLNKTHEIENTCIQITGVFNSKHMCSRIIDIHIIQEFLNCGITDNYICLNMTRFNVVYVIIIILFIGLKNRLLRISRQQHKTAMDRVRKEFNL